MTDVSKVREHLKTVIDNVVNNRAQMANQVAQMEQQLSVLKDQHETAGTLIVALEHLLELGEEAAAKVLKKVEALLGAEAQVASSPSQPAAGQADAPAAGAAQG